MNERGGEFIKNDISKLSGRKDVLPKFVGDRVVLGSDNEGIYRRQISKLVGEIEDGRVLDSSNPDRRTLASKVLKDNFNVATLKDLRDGQQDSKKAEYVRDNLKKYEERLAKAILISLKKSGVAESDLVSPEKIDEKLPEELKGLGEKISSFVITDPKIKEALAEVDLNRNGLKIDYYDEKKERVLEKIKTASKDIYKSLNPKNINQVELAINYLNSLQREVSRNLEKESITDEIITFLDDYVIRKDVTVDEDLNLRNAHGGDDFEVEMVDGKEVILENGKKKYVHQETTDWLNNREIKATELIMICSGGRFDSIEQIDEKYTEGGILSPYYTNDKDGTRGEKEYLVGLKDTLGFCVYETIQNSEVDANKTILGTLNTNRVDRLIPKVMEGLSDEVVINAAKDSFLREQLRTICMLDKDKKFSLMAIHGGFSSLDVKEQLKRDINSVVSTISKDKRLGKDKSFTSEAIRIQQWLKGRNKEYQQLIDLQVKIGRGGGEIMPGESKERYELARTLLNTVEASGSPPGSLNIMEQCTKLFNMTQSEMVEQELKTEIKARLSLAFMYYHMHAAGGLLNNRGQSIEDAHEQGFKEGLLIDKNAMEFFLKTGVNGLPGANGLPVAECWNAIEELNFGWENGKPVPGNESYYNLLVKMMGVNYSFHKETQRITLDLEYKDKIDEKTGKVVKDEKGINIKTKDVDFDSPKTKKVFKPLIGRDASNKEISTLEGEYLLSFREQGMKYLNQRGSLTDVEFLSKWTDKLRYNFFGDFNKLQNEESFFWGEGAENAMRFNYFTDVNLGRKGMVRDFILNGIKEKREAENIGKSETEKLITDKKSLEKGFELAEKLLESTAETSVFNPCFAGHNDFSELILTEANSKDRQKKMKVIGARVAMAEIVSFYTTWPRYIAGEKDSDRRSVFKPLYAKEIHTERMDNPKSDSYFLMTAILPKKILPVQAFFMKEDISSKDVLTVEHWKKLYDPISKVIDYSQDVLRDESMKTNTVKIEKGKNDKTLKYRLRLLAVQAVVQMAERYSTGWDWGNLYKLGQLVTREYVTIEDKQKNAERSSFITFNDFWGEIWKSLTLRERMGERLTMLNAEERARSSEIFKIKIP